MKRKPTEWKKIFTDTTLNKVLIYKLHKEFIQLDSKNNPKQSAQKNGKRI